MILNVLYTIENRLRGPNCTVTDSHSKIKYPLARVTLAVCTGNRVGLDHVAPSIHNVAGM